MLPAISLGGSHLAFGISAVLLGAWVALGRKGTARHKWIGRAYLMTMILLNFSALMLYKLTGHLNAFHIAAMISLATLVAGYLPARSRRPGWTVPHAYFMSWSYCGLLAATAAEIASRLPGWDFVWSVVISSLLVMLAGGILIARKLRPLIAERERP